MDLPDYRIDKEKEIDPVGIFLQKTHQNSGVRNIFVRAY